MKQDAQTNQTIPTKNLMKPKQMHKKKKSNKTHGKNPQPLWTLDLVEREN